MEKSCDECKHNDDGVCVIGAGEECYIESNKYWEPKEEDVVNHPKHYNMYEKEVIDVIEDCLTVEEFKGYLKGNMIKYRMRAGWKDRDKRTEDLDKSNWYQDKLDE